MTRSELLSELLELQQLYEQTKQHLEDACRTGEQLRLRQLSLEKQVNALVTSKGGLKLMDGGKTLPPRSLP